MAFLTGVNLETRLHVDVEEFDAPLLALPAPPQPKRRVHPEIPSVLQLRDAPEPEAPQFRKLLDDCSNLNRDDSLDELRRMIKKTRKKMDTQKEVMKGFLHDVNQIRMMDRNFSADDDTPRGPAAIKDAPSHRAITAGPGGELALKLPGGPAAIKDVPGHRAITGGPAGPPRALGPPALPHSASAGKLPGPDSRGTSLRGSCSVSGPVGNSMATRTQSQPTLRPAAALADIDTTPIQMPARRAPPGGYGRSSEGSRGRESSQLRLQARRDAQLAAETPIRRRAPLLSGMGQGGGASGLRGL